jgi:NAD(P)-dependent dehydrogenase (short-subunit alcohol dehydrogenase family)
LRFPLPRYLLGALPHEGTPMAQKSILITGCSSGIGQYAAIALKKRGWRVFATVRNEADRARLTSEGLDVLLLDYADQASIAAALDQVLSATGGRLDALVNNGAYSQPGAIEDLPTELLRAQFEVNVFGWHELTRLVVPVMRRQGSGRIVQISSVLGFLGGRFSGAYVGSKFAIEGLTDSLRLEVAGSGVAAVLIEPGPIATRFIEHAVKVARASIDIAGSVHREAYERALTQMAQRDRSPFERGPEAVFAKLIRALESKRPRARYRVTFATHMAAAMKRVLPTRLLDWVLLRAT